MLNFRTSLALVLFTTLVTVICETNSKFAYTHVGCDLEAEGGVVTGGLEKEFRSRLTKFGLSIESDDRVLRLVAQSVCEEDTAKKDKKKLQDKLEVEKGKKWETTLWTGAICSIVGLVIGFCFGICFRRRATNRANNDNFVANSVSSPLPIPIPCRNIDPIEVVVDVVPTVTRPVPTVTRPVPTVTRPVPTVARPVPIPRTSILNAMSIPSSVEMNGIARDVGQVYSTGRAAYGTVKELVKAFNDGRNN